MRSKHSAHPFLRRLLRNERGNFAMIMALVAIPLMGIVGLGIDLTRAYIAQTRLQGAVDNAALAAAGLAGQPTATIKQITTNYFYSNYHADFWAPPAAPEVTVNASGTVHVSATATSPNFFLTIFGYNQFTVASAADAVGQAHGLEVVLVLDVTSSMCDGMAPCSSGTKLTALKNASAELVNILFGGQNTSQYLKIGIVPFTSSVKVDPTTALNNGWIDTTGSSSSSRLDFDNSLGNNYAYAMLTQYMNGTSWTGCVEARPTPTSGTYAGVHLEETDIAPDPSNPDTQWVPFFYPDDPDTNTNNGRGYPNSYLSDGTNGGDVARMTYSAKYQGKSPSLNTGATASGPNKNCAPSEIQPLTNDKLTLTNMISGLKADGYTHIPLGIGWGWRVLSPGAPYTEGHPYSDTLWDKVLIIETDGCNTMPPSTGEPGNCETVNANGSASLGTDYSAYGFGYQQRLGNGINNTQKMLNAINDSMSRVCANIKAVTRPDGSPAIKIYTIGFGSEANQAENKALLQGCATVPSDYFYAPTTAELQNVFTAIGNSLSKIRLTK